MRDTGFPKKDVDKLLKSFTNTIFDQLSKGEQVRIMGFGHFYVADTKERAGRNPQTGEPMLIPASKAPRFKSGTVLRDAALMSAQGE